LQMKITLTFQLKIWRTFPMKILVMPKPIEGVSREELLQHAAEEIQAV
jgi:hypothetical protein